MSKHLVTIFSQYPFATGEKITIANGPRAGDWEVIGLSDRTVKLRCPVSGREFAWDRFCYQVEKKENEQWPHHNGG